jgi:hypothetical protein
VNNPFCFLLTKLKYYEVRALCWGVKSDGGIEEGKKLCYVRRKGMCRCCWEGKRREGGEGGRERGREKKRDQSLPL